MSALLQAPDGKVLINIENAGIPLQVYDMTNTPVFNIPGEDHTYVDIDNVIRYYDDAKMPHAEVLRQVKKRVEAGE